MWCLIPDENKYVYIDVDDHGNIVSMTIEHAEESGGLEELVYREMSHETA